MTTPLAARFPGCRFLLVGVTALQLGLARAEDRVSYKYQDYRESAGRIAVQVHSAMFEKDLGPLTQLRVQGIVDTIAGATPTGQPPTTPGGQVPLARLTERREAWNADLSRQFERLTLIGGVAESRESDYVSRGVSLNTLIDFNAKNTTLALGASTTDDDVKVFFQEPRRRKRTYDFIAGVTQLLDPETSVTLNVTFGRATGYLSDPYKLVQKRVEVIPGVFLRQTFNENRPEDRNRWIVLAGLNRAMPKLRGTLDASYRFHRDDFGVTSHTLTAEWYQKVGQQLLVRPHVRWYRQGAADFYLVSLDGTPITPGNAPTGRAPFFSADYRLSEMETLTYGLKLVWSPTERWQVDAALERYDMRGRDGITSGSAYPDATVATYGVRLLF